MYNAPGQEDRCTVSRENAMLNWFKRAKGQPKSKDPSALDLIPLKELEIGVVTTALLSTEPINDAWPSAREG